MRKFVAVDAAFSRTAYSSLLALAVGLDGEGKVVILAWGLLAREDTEGWSWFMQGLRESLEGLNERECVIISDRQKVRVDVSWIKQRRARSCYLHHPGSKSRYCLDLSRGNRGIL